MFGGPAVRLDDHVGPVLPLCIDLLNVMCLLLVSLFIVFQRVQQAGRHGGDNGQDGLWPRAHSVLPRVTGVGEKNTAPEKMCGKTGFRSAESRGWRAPSAAGLQGEGSPKRGVSPHEQEEEGRQPDGSRECGATRRDATRYDTSWG